MRQPPSVKKTSIIAGEGKSEKIFLEYLKTLYWTNDGKHVVKIYKNIQEGHGGGSSINVAGEVMNQFGCLPRDAIVLLLDQDIAGDLSCTDIKQQAIKRCRYKSVIPKDRIKCIMMLPCFEGFILRILGKKISGNSSYCKQQFEMIFGKKAPKVDQGNYTRHCPKKLLEEKRKQISELDKLIRYFEIATKADFSSYFGG